MGYADEQTARDLGVPLGSRFGGEEAEIALQQSKANLELTNENILNTEKERQYIGTYKPDSSAKGIDETRINTAYNNVKNGSETGADLAILYDAGYSEKDIASIKGSNGGPSDDDIALAFSNLDDNKVGTMKDIEILLAAGADEAELKAEYPYIWDPTLLPIGKESTMN